MIHFKLMKGQNMHFFLAELRRQFHGIWLGKTSKGKVVFTGLRNLEQRVKRDAVHWLRYKPNGKALLFFVRTDQKGFFCRKTFRYHTAKTNDNPPRVNKPLETLNVIVGPDGLLWTNKKWSKRWCPQSNKPLPGGILEEQFSWPGAGSKPRCHHVIKKEGAQKPRCHHVIIDNKNARD